MERQAEDIFDLCLKKVNQGVSVDEIVEKYPEKKEELRELLEIAEDISNLPTPHVRDEAMASCILKVANALKSQKRGELRGWRLWKVRLYQVHWPRLIYSPSPAWAKALIFILIGSILSWGTVNLAAESLPGDLLYPMKVTTEKVRFFLTIDPGKKVELRITNSEERMQELVKYLSKRGELNTQSLKAMLDETALVMEHLPKLPEDQAAAYCLKLEHHCAYQMDVLETIKLRVTSSQQQELDRAIRICNHRMDWMAKIRRNEVPTGRWADTDLE